MADNQQIGVIYSPWVEEAEPLAKTLVDALSKDHNPWVCSVLELDANADTAKRCSTFVTIGGDGTSQYQNEQEVFDRNPSYFSPHWRILTFVVFE